MLRKINNPDAATKFRAQLEVFNLSVKNFLCNEPVDYVDMRSSWRGVTSCFSIVNTCAPVYSPLYVSTFNPSVVLRLRSCVAGCYVTRCQHGRLVGELSQPLFLSDTSYGPVPLRCRNLQYVTVEKLECRTCYDSIPRSAVKRREHFTGCRYLRYLSSPGRAYRFAPYENFGFLPAAPRLGEGDSPIQHSEDVEEVYVPPPVIPLVDLLDEDVDDGSGVGPVGPVGPVVCVNRVKSEVV